MDRHNSLVNTACFQCGELSLIGESFCRACGFGAGGELTSRPFVALLIRMAAVALVLGALVPVIALFLAGEFSAHQLPAVAIAATVIALAGFAWFFAARFCPRYLSAGAPKDLRFLSSGRDSDGYLNS